MNIKPFSCCLLCQCLNFSFVCIWKISKVCVDFLDKKGNLLFANVIYCKKLSVYCLDEWNEHGKRKVIGRILNINCKNLDVTHGPLSNCAKKLELKVCFSCNFCLVCVRGNLNESFDGAYEALHVFYVTMNYIASKFWLELFLVFCRHHVDEIEDTIVRLNVISGRHHEFVHEL